MSEIIKEKTEAARSIRPELMGFDQRKKVVETLISAIEYESQKGATSGLAEVVSALGDFIQRNGNR
jgi:hypothetical protein